MKTRIGVIGCGGVISRKVGDIAQRIGVDIAQSNSVLICGGRGGVMEAACRGSKSAGGLSVGILPSVDLEDSNPYVDVCITTGMGFARNALVVSSSDVVIMVNGRAGTLSEVCLALNYGRSVVVVSDSGGLADSVKEKLCEMGIVQKLYSAKAADAVQTALSLIGK